MYLHKNKIRIPGGNMNVNKGCNQYWFVNIFQNDSLDFTSFLQIAFIIKEGFLQLVCKVLVRSTFYTCVAIKNLLGNSIGSYNLFIFIALCDSVSGIEA